MGAFQIVAVFFQRREQENAEFTLRISAKPFYLMFSALKILPNEFVSATI